MSNVWNEENMYMALVAGCTFSVYTHADTHVDFEESSDGWTLRASAFTPTTAGNINTNPATALIDFVDFPIILG